MAYETHRKVNTVCRYVILLVVGVSMVHPLIWMIGVSSMTNEQVFSSVSFISKAPTLNGYKKGFAGYQGMTPLHFMVGTYKFVIPKVLFTVALATLTAYGSARFNFMGKRLSFAALLSTLFLPQVVLNVPQYILFDQTGWLDSYLPIVIPSLLVGDIYFIYMLIQSLWGIPRELEEVAEIDGCGIMQRLWYVTVPMLKPSIASCALFQFVWASNDFMGSLIYVNAVAKYPVSIFLRMSMDADVGFEQNRILAMSLTAIIPSPVVFLAAQDSFVEGIAVGGVKG